MERISIFTPTYNRKKLLYRAYMSLCSQTSKDFIWLIIDDGSTDGTQEIVQEWIDEEKICIEYYYKRNGGKHSAFNHMLDVLHTELVMIALDSDDYLKVDAVEKMLYYWKKRPCHIRGMTFGCEDAKKHKLMYQRFKKELILGSPSLQEAFINGYFKGEAEYLIESELIKKYKYPEYANEKFVTEAFVFLQINVPFEWKKNSIYVREYQMDGLTRGLFKGYLNNPSGYLEYNLLRLKMVKDLRRKIKYCIFINAFSFLNRKKKILKNMESDNYFLIRLCRLPGIMLAGLIWAKGR